MAAAGTQESVSLSLSMEDALCGGRCVDGKMKNESSTSIFLEV